MAVRTADGALRDDLVIPQGSYWPYSWPISGPVNLIGWTVRCLIRTSAAPSAAVLFEWNTATLISTPTVGIATVSGLTVGLLLDGDSDSAYWTFADGVYDVLIRDPSSKPTRIVSGSIRVTPSITH